MPSIRTLKIAVRFSRMVAVTGLWAVFSVATHGQSPGAANGLSLDANGDTAQTVTDGRLIGFWEYRGEQGSITLEFQTESRLIFAGREVTYSLRPGIIRVLDEAGEVDYEYELRGNTLCLTLSDGKQPGFELRFARVNLTPNGTSSRSPQG